MGSSQNKTNKMKQQQFSLRLEDKDKMTNKIHFSQLPFCFSLINVKNLYTLHFERNNYNNWNPIFYKL